MIINHLVAFKFFGGASAVAQATGVLVVYAFTVHVESPIAFTSRVEAPIAFTSRVEAPIEFEVNP